MDIRKIIREELEKICSFTIMEGHTTNDKNYEINPEEIWKKIDELRKKGKSLDSDVSGNLADLQVLSTGSRSGRDLAEIGYPDGTVVLFYKSMKGTGHKTQGDWYPIPGFAARQYGRVPAGWFIKDSDINKMYDSQVFQGTKDYLMANDGQQEIEEIDLSIGGHGTKPGVPRRFPQDDEGGHSLNLSVSDGPHQFPDEEDL
jgi:hypothetical protein